ncbi:glycosyltransferase family 4 protein [Candidatus Woesearchaeota archaeon]|nr:glycosyltransferase family 4 protein [Candidatus Woesearchaeota archaeon]
MKVIRVIETFYPNVTGPVNQAYQISLRLEQQGIHSPITTTTFKAKDAPECEHYKGVSVERCKPWFRFLQYIITPSMISVFKNTDIIHAHNYRSFQTDLSFVMAKLLRKPFVLNTHGGLLGYDKYLKNSWVKLPYRLYDVLTMKMVAKKADAVIVSSHFEKKEALKYGVAEDKIQVIPMGIDAQQYYVDRTKRKNKILTLLFVGRISRNRNIAPLIRAMSLLKKEAIVLRIVGEEIVNSATDKPGYLDEMKELVKELDVGENITFAGLKYGKELIDEYKKADIFVYTSLSENFGQTILEAGASGLALVCTPVGIVNDIVENGKNGFVVKDEPEQIANRILRLRIRSLRLNLGKAIQQNVEKEYDWKKIIEKYIGVYNKVLKKGT